MDEWPLEKKQRVIEIVRDLQLPEKGDALDFGCGNGVLTEVVRQVLPAWNVYGTDISITAIDHAKARYPDCCFFHLEDNHCRDKKFDFLFTNHVLEHVYSLQETFKELVDFLKPISFMLHLLPCGNKGSFEYRVCLLNREGINRKMGNRFFFEDHSHLRRLTGSQLKDLAGEKSFFLINEFYSNHFYGAIEYITKSSLKFILILTDTRLAVDRVAKVRLISLRVLLSLIFFIRRPLENIREYFKEKGTLKHSVFCILIGPYYIFSLFIDSYFLKRADIEWSTRKTDPRGSEMTLFFKRDLLDI